MPFHDIGFDPDKDYLLDPQMKDTKVAICDCCGHQIFPGELYYELYICRGLSQVVGKDSLILCKDCECEIEERIL